MKRVNWTEKDLDKACERINANQSWHQRQEEMRVRAEFRQEQNAAKKKTKGKRDRKPKGPLKPDAFCLFVQAATGYLPTREYKFHPNRGWKIDYAITELMIAIEREGGVYTGGRHTRPVGFLKDMEKYNELAIMGWTLIRAIPDDMQTDKVLRLVELAIELKK